MTKRDSGAVQGLLDGLRELVEQGLAGDGGAVVTTGYPFQQRSLPPDRPVVWLGVEKISAAGSCFSPWLGEKGEGPDAGAEVLGRELEIGLRVEILHRYDGGVCHRLFGELCQLLLLTRGRPQVRELSCGTAAFDREAGAFRLVCKGTLRAILTQSEEGLPLEKIIVKRKDQTSGAEKDPQEGEGSPPDGSEKEAEV